MKKQWLYTFTVMNFIYLTLSTMHNDNDKPKTATLTAILTASSEKEKGKLDDKNDDTHNAPGEKTLTPAEQLTKDLAKLGAKECLSDNDNDDSSKG